jgi:hypothetical protein
MSENSCLNIWTVRYRILSLIYQKRKTMTTREKARQLTTKVNQIIKTMTQNKKAGYAPTFEYLRYVVGLKIERDRLWELSEQK